MDGRGSLRLGVCLLIAAAGCQAPVKLKDPPPLVLVSYGNFEAGEAFADRTGPDRQQQLCESARVDYERALTIDPKCMPAYQGLARLYTAMQDLPLAVETYQKALKLAPNNASLWFELGVCHNYQKNVGPALECVERAAQLEPRNRSYVNALGIILAEAGRYKESLQCFARSGGEAMSYYRLAQTLHHLHKPEMSRRCLEVAVQKDPSLAPPVQQASYQQPAAPEEPNDPPPQPEPAANPPSPPQQILLPPVPLINGDDEQPEP